MAVDLSKYFSSKSFTPVNWSAIVCAFVQVFYTKSDKKDGCLRNLICSDLYHIAYIHNDHPMMQLTVEAALVPQNETAKSDFWNAVRSTDSGFVPKCHPVSLNSENQIIFKGMKRRVTSQIRDIPKEPKRLLFETYPKLADDMLLGRDQQEIERQYTIFLEAMRAYSSVGIKLTEYKPICKEEKHNSPTHQQETEELLNLQKALEEAQQEIVSLRSSLQEASRQLLEIKGKC